MTSEYDDDEIKLIVVTSTQTASSKADRIEEYCFENQNGMVGVYGAEVRFVFANDTFAAQHELDEEGYYTFTCDASDLDYDKVDYTKFTPFVSSSGEFDIKKLKNEWSAWCQDKMAEKRKTNLRVASSSSTIEQIVNALNNHDDEDDPELRINIDMVMDFPWCIPHSCFEDDIGPLGAIHPDGYAIMEGDWSNNYQWCYVSLERFFEFRVDNEASDEELSQQVEIWMNEFHETRKKRAAE